MDTNLIYNFAWYPIGVGDPDSIWIETGEERENRIEEEKKTENPEEYQEERIEQEYDKENEVEKENK